MRPVRKILGPAITNKKEHTKTSRVLKMLPLYDDIRAKFDQCREQLSTALSLYCFQKVCNSFQSASRGVDDVGVNELHDRTAARIGIDCSLSSLLSDCILLIVCLFTKEGT